MFCSRSPRWTTPVLICVSIVVLGVTPRPCRAHARGRSAVRACEADYKAALQRERAGQLREAKQAWQNCALSCGTQLRRICVSRSHQLEAEIPSIVPIVSDGTGSPRSDVAVRMDGLLLAAKLDGRALSVDPGLHEFTFQGDEGAHAATQVMVAQGSHDVPIAITLQREPFPAGPSKSKTRVPNLQLTAAVADVSPAPASSSPLRAAASSSSAWPYLVGGAGLAGVGGYTLLLMWGRKDNGRLKQCSPDCPQASVDHVRALYLAADISLGVGIAALGTAAWLLLTSGAPKQEAADRTALQLSVMSVRAGAVANVSGAL